jgi:hypothetical protein
MLSLPLPGRTRLPDWIRIREKGVLLNRELITASVITHTAQQASRLVLDRAGTWPRDRVTRRTILEVRDGKGSWGRHAPAQPSSEWFMEGLKHEKVTPDSDNDGIPDAWERAHGLDANNATDHGQIMKSGYPAIEEYLNERAMRRIAETGN